MKIVFPVLSLETGGGARFIYQLANALLDRGHNVEIVIPAKGALRWPVRAKITQVKELTASVIPPADFILPNFYLTVFPALQSQQGRVVRLSLGYEPLWVENAELAKKTYLLGTPILSISEWHRKLMLDQIGVDSTVISGGVDTSVFIPYPKLSSETGRKSIFYILRAKSHGYTWKGNDDFLEACKRLKREVPDFDINLVLPEREPFESPVPCIIKTANTDSEMARLYAQTDLFVYTSYFEAFGLPPLEAMACRTAVITTDCGGIRDYARQDKNCLIVPPSDIDQLTSALYELLSNDEKRQRLAVSGQRSVQPWTWQRTAYQVETFLLSLLDK